MLPDTPGRIDYLAEQPATILTAPRSPEEWLKELTEAMDSRRVELERVRNYVTGNAPLPRGATQHAEAYADFQKKARTNFANLIVAAPSERMNVAGFRVGEEPSDNDAARRLWRRSSGQTLASDVHRNMMTYGVAYAMASVGPDGRAVLTSESPFTTITDHDPVLPSVVRAGLKTWNDQGEDHAVLHLPGEVHYYRRSGATRLGARRVAGGWEMERAPRSTGLSVVPIVRFVNLDGVGEFAQHTDLLDRINWVILQRLLITAMQAFRQRAIKGDLDQEDENGDPIDWEALFSPGPDALWNLPDGIEIWESQPGDIGQILSAVKDDIRDLSAVTRTPMSVLSPDSANQSAEGASLTREGLVFKAEDRCDRATPSWESLLAIGLVLDGTEAEVEVQWAPCERLSMAERFDALTKAGDLPWRRRMTDILGYDAATVDQMETERAADALNAILSSQVPAAPQSGAQPAAVNSADEAIALKAKADALGSLIRAGVTAEDAARQTGLNVDFIPGTPITLRPPDASA